MVMQQQRRQRRQQQQQRVTLGAHSSLFSGCCGGLAWKVASLALQLGTSIWQPAVVRGPAAVLFMRAAPPSQIAAHPSRHSYLHSIHLPTPPLQLMERCVSMTLIPAAAPSCCACIMAGCRPCSTCGMASWICWSGAADCLPTIAVAFEAGGQGVRKRWCAAWRSGIAGQVWQEAHYALPIDSELGQPLHPSKPKFGWLGCFRCCVPEAHGAMLHCPLTSRISSCTCMPHALQRWRGRPPAHFRQRQLADPG